MFEKEFRHIVQRQRELRRNRRRSMSAHPHIRTGSAGSNGGQSSMDIHPLRSIAETLRGRLSGEFETTEKAEVPEAGPVPQNQDSLATLQSRDNESSKRRDGELGSNPGDDHISFGPDRPMSQGSIEHERARTLSFVGVGANPNSTAYSAPSSYFLRRRIPEAIREVGHDVIEPLEVLYPHYITKENTSRNGRFYNLSRDEREHLGGVEYRAIGLLAWCVPVYFVMWQLLGALGLGAYMAHNKAAVARGNGIDPW